MINYSLFFNLMIFLLLIAGDSVILYMTVYKILQGHFGSPVANKTSILKVNILVLLSIYLSSFVIGYVSFFLCTLFYDKTSEIYSFNTITWMVVIPTVTSLIYFGYNLSNEMNRGKLRRDARKSVFTNTP